MRYTEIKKCVVVGSSPKLLSEENGSKIDQYEVIIRCNFAMIKNFEKFVGSRTDYRLINVHVYNYLFKDHSIKHNKNFIKTFGAATKHKTNEIIYNDEILITKDHREMKMVRKKGAEERLLKEHQIKATVFSMPVEALQKARFHTEVSCGAYALAFAEYLFPNAEVDAYGFSFYNNEEHCSHYYEDIATKKLGHNYQTEKKLIKNLKRVNFL